MSCSSKTQSGPSSSLHSLLFQIKSVDWDCNAAGGKEEWKQTLQPNAHVSLSRAEEGVGVFKMILWEILPGKLNRLKERMREREVERGIERWLMI